MQITQQVANMPSKQIFLFSAQVANPELHRTKGKPNNKLNLHRTKTNWWKQIAKVLKFKSNKPQVVQTNTEIEANVNQSEGVQAKTRNQTESSKRIHQ